MIDQYLRKVPLQAPSRVQPCVMCRGPATVTEPDDGGGWLCKACVERLASSPNGAVLGVSLMRRRLSAEVMELKQSQ